MSMLERHCGVIWNTSIIDINRQDIIVILELMQQKGLKDVVKRLFGYLDRIYMYCVTKEYIPHNIIGDIDKKTIIKKYKKEKRPAITNPIELKVLIADINDYENRFKSDVSTIYALHLSKYVVLRAVVLRSLEWGK